MAEKTSQMIELGTIAPEFSLPDPEGNVHSLGYGATAYLVMFICNHCPYVKHLADHFSQFARHYRSYGLQVIAINSNDYRSHPEDNPEKMREEAALRKYDFPYLIDETQLVARAFQAACTPDFFLFDNAGKLAYRGQFDASRPQNGHPVTGAAMRAAINVVLAGQSLPEDSQVPSMGCNIKWKAGNEPTYFG